ncbi:MAG: 3-phosphoshikimate 1-carboxyvinyltransferase [Bacteroidales bacterium]|nr:3-phosphoshikimate 1-carboxyvinyltransferase [Bacteroidales bacterium]
MTKTIIAISQKINKTVKAPASKSVFQRVIACAVLAEDDIIIYNPSFCNDCKAALSIAENLGAEVIIEINKIIIRPGKNKISNTINCRESGLSVRMFSPITALFGKTVTIKGTGSLKKRPINEIQAALTQLGIECQTNKGFIPISVSGKLSGGNAEIDGSLSSQILTGLLIALPKVKEDSVIKVHNLKSKPYIDLTLNILSSFGIKIRNENYKEFHIKGNQQFKAINYTVEGDWSGASFLLVAGLIAGEIKVTGLNINSVQADKKIIDAIHFANGTITVNKDAVITKKSKLKAFKFNATDCPDLFPPLVVMAACCIGTSEIIGVNRLKHKESNRAEVLQQEFKKIGINIKIINNKMFIEGGKISGGIVESHNDHRIAMAAATAALASEKEIIINNAECINKSYPTFYEDLLGYTFK